MDQNLLTVAILLCFYVGVYMSLHEGLGFHDFL
jgi:hypothetical protein